VFRSFISTDPGVGVIVGELAILTLIVDVRTPLSVAVITAFPSETAVIKPVSLTLATKPLLELYVIFFTYELDGKIEYPI